MQYGGKRPGFSAVERQQIRNIFMANAFFPQKFPYPPFEHSTFCGLHFPVIDKWTLDDFFAGTPRCDAQFVDGASLVRSSKKMGAANTQNLFTNAQKKLLGMQRYGCPPDCMLAFCILDGDSKGRLWWSQKQPCAMLFPHDRKKPILCNQNRRCRGLKHSASHDRCASTTAPPTAWIGQ